MNMENDEDDEIDEYCVTARSETARSSRRPSPAPRKYMSDNLSLTSKASSRDKTEDVSGSRNSVYSRDDGLLTSRRSSSRSNKDSSRHQRDRDRVYSSRSSERILGSNSSLQNIPDEMGSNASLSSASDLVVRNGRHNGKKFNCAFVAASSKYCLSLSYRSGIFQQYSYFSEFFFSKLNFYILYLKCT